MLKILTYPNNILETPATPVNFPLNSEDQTLIREMWETVQGIGVGLAAPQVGVSKQILIVHMSEDDDLKRETKEPDFVAINPKIVFESQIQSYMVEGCLSFPEEYWRIKRSSNIEVEFETIGNFKEFIEKGAEPTYKKKRIKAKGWLSRILQHEIDHLNGKIFTKMGGRKLSKRELEGETVVD
jgi:peptide deformylase